MTGNQETLIQMHVRSPEWAQNLLLAGYRGSHAHGTYVPPEEPKGTDDVDVFGIAVHPEEYYLGVDGYVNKSSEVTFNTNLEHLDIETHEIRKFMHLIGKGNPNVHSHLWMADEDYLLVSYAGQKLLDFREELLSRKMLDAFGGYAYGQLARMQKMEKQGYMGAKREAIVKEHGYDIKNAAHCVRLLLAACSLVEQRKLLVKLEGENLELVLSIKKGERSLEWVQRKALELFNRFDAIKHSSDLPDQVDRTLLNHLTKTVIQLYWV